MADSKKSAPLTVAEAEAEWRRQQAQQQQPATNLNPAEVFAKRKAQAEQAQPGARQPSATERPKAPFGSLDAASSVYAKRAEQVRQATEGTAP